MIENYDKEIEKTYHPENFLNTYEINIKSHAFGVPDYEDECQAHNIDEAVEVFRMRIARASNGEEVWGKKTLRSFIQEVKYE